MKVYISGKISGLDSEEVKVKFTEAEDFLNEIGIEAVNPLKNGLSVDNAWIKHLCKDIEMLNDCDSIYMMDGKKAPVLVSNMTLRFVRARLFCLHRISYAIRVLC